MDTPGRTVGGRYRLIEPLGRGGMGTVWRAEDAVLGRQVAVKEVAFPHGLSDEDRENLRERTRREARAAARLDHPSAVTVYDVVEEDGQPWLVLELVEARTLAELVRSDGPLTVRETAHVGLALLGALEAAHAQGIVHRDVKPSNVLISRTGSTGLGRVVLTDFGIATSAGDASITSTGLLLGSPSYISPERARGLPPGPAADLWSLGATLFTAVEGRPPYDKGEPLPTLTAVVTGDQEPYVAAGPLVPVLDGLLAPDPDRRLSSSQARALLQEVLSTADLGALPVPQPEPQAEVRSERTTALPVGPGAGLPAPEPVAPRTVVAAAPRADPPPPRVSPPRPGDTPAPRRRGALLALLGLVALLGLGGVALSSLTGNDPATDPRAAAGPSSAASAEASPGSDGQGEGDGQQVDPDDGVAAVPAGFKTDEGAPGWRVAVPEGWVESEFRGFPQYRDPETGRTLRVSTGPGVEHAVSDRRRQARSFAATYPSYREIAIREVDYRDYPAADWEFTYTAGGAELHVINRVFNVNGTGHSLYFQTRARDFPQAREDFDRILASFRPA